MKNTVSLLIGALTLMTLCAAAFADSLETPGSSTLPSELKGVGNKGQKQTYTNVHSGKTVNASAKVANTDAHQDGHPFELGGIIPE